MHERHSTSVSERLDRPHAFEVVAPLGSVWFGERWLVRRPESVEPEVLYVRDTAGEPDEAARLTAGLDRFRQVVSPHMLCPADWGRVRPVGLWLATHFVGQKLQVLSLADLVAAKGGRVEPVEARYAAQQLLATLAPAQAAGVQHGPLQPAEILVDRHGRLAVELFGVRRLLEPRRTPPSDSDAEEVASVCTIVWWLLFGAQPAESSSDRTESIQRLASMPKGGRRLASWAGEGIAGGFEDALHAARTLGIEVDVEPLTSTPGATARQSTVRR